MIKYYLTSLFFHNNYNYKNKNKVNLNKFNPVNIFCLTTL